MRAVSADTNPVYRVPRKRVMTLLLESPGVGSSPFSAAASWGLLLLLLFAIRRSTPAIISHSRGQPAAFDTLVHSPSPPFRPLCAGRSLAAESGPLRSIISIHRNPHSIWMRLQNRRPLPAWLSLSLSLSLSRLESDRSPLAYARCVACRSVQIS